MRDKKGRLLRIHSKLTPEDEAMIDYMETKDAERKADEVVFRKGEDWLDPYKSTFTLPDDITQEEWDRFYGSAVIFIDYNGIDKARAYVEAMQKAIEDRGAKA